MHGDDLLSAQGLLTAAGSTSFSRGKDYVRRVQGLRASAGDAQASIRGSDVYDVDLDWSGRRLTGRCTCPHYARGNFCKHLVALGLAVLDSQSVARMPLGLADHDGDVDLAVEVLSRGEHPQYAAIVDRLRLAGRLDDVTAWVDRGVAAGRVSPDHSGSRDYWLDPEEVAGEYLALDRVADAVEVFRDGFSRRPDLTSYAALVAFAGSIGLEEENRGWALRRLRMQASRTPADAALLVQIALAEYDLDAAWQVADEFGPGHAWQSLAAASADVAPARAAALHRAEIDDLLRFTNASRYAAIAQALAAVRELSLRAGEERDFAAYLTDIRTTYKRRPALMSALARRGL